MAPTAPTIAIVSESAAFGSILCSLLRRERGWRVRGFATARALHDYMRIAPVAIVVCDYELEGALLPTFAARLRQDGDLVSRDAQILALSRIVEPDMRKACVASGIDEVIVKPMSPAYLAERIRARLEGGTVTHIRTSGRYRGPERRGRLLDADPRDFPHERRQANIIAFPLPPSPPGPPAPPA